MLEPAMLAHRREKPIAIGRIVVQRAHARADRLGHRGEAEHPCEFGIARDERAVRARRVDAEQGVFEQLTVALFVRGRSDDAHRGRRIIGGGASPVR
jgi:hypothetical protein